MATDILKEPRIRQLIAGVLMLGIVAVTWKWSMSFETFQKGLANTWLRPNSGTLPTSGSGTVPTNGTIKFFYHLRDCYRHRLWKGETELVDCKSLPKVLLLTWATESTFSRFRNEVYWKACYAHSHGFDLIIADPYDTTEHVLWYKEAHMWQWWTMLQEQLPNYDYVFVTEGDALFSDYWLHFPVWAYDRTGRHDMFVMDQCYSDWGYNTNGLLFKSTKWSMEFLRSVLNLSSKQVVLGDVAGWMEQILEALGKEAAKSWTQAVYPYDNKCREKMTLQDEGFVSISKTDNYYVQRAAEYSKCFFSELDRLAGPFQQRQSEHIDFVPLVDASDRFEDANFPWANCWSLLRDPVYGPACRGNADAAKSCFTLHSNGLQKMLDSHNIVGVCPDPTFDWNASPYNSGNRPSTTSTSTYFFQIQDCQRYVYWAGRKDQECLTSWPRVLILTWATEAMYHKYPNEMYWKACYAHTHQYDLLITDPFSTLEELDILFYRNDNLFKRWSTLMKVLPDYEYVFYVDADVLFLEHWLHFPVWAFDEGLHDLSIMDQCYTDMGYNSNAFLFKNTKWSMDFIQKMVAFQNQNIALADTGAWMEQVLITLGGEAEATGAQGYSNECRSLLSLPESIKLLSAKDELVFYEKNYSQCFFEQLDRLAGTYNQRSSKHIAFNPVLNAGNAALHFPMPWANCWSFMRDPWNSRACVGNAGYAQSCFTFHYNEVVVDLKTQRIAGTCPDPSFKWKPSPYNARNRPTTTTTSPYYFQRRDCKRYLAWPARLDNQCKSLPRVLLFTFGTESTLHIYRNEVYWKACYAHAHNYDLLVVDPFNTTEEVPALWFRTSNIFKIWSALLQVLPQYDYVFVTHADVLISERWLNFPVWAYDNAGQHDLTIMDQCFYEFGFDSSGLLFKSTNWSIDFIQKTLDFKNKELLMGAWMEQVLVSLGDEAEASGEHYLNECRQLLELKYFSLQEALETKFYSERLSNYTKCFFSHLDRMAGHYNKRKSKHIRFNPVVDAHDTSSDKILPWANCWYLFRDPLNQGRCVGSMDADSSCFAFHWNQGTNPAKPEGGVYGKCPDRSFKWNLSPFNTINRPSTTTTSTYFFQARDCKRHLHWPGRTDNMCKKMPRVLIFTWCTESTFVSFQNEMYWKACYAHAHGFELLIADPLNMTEKRFNKNTAQGWYEKQFLWAWWISLKDLLPQYDYVFTVGADVLFNSHWLNWPVWAFSGGQDDLSIMDQCYSDWGLNENAFLFRNTKWSKQFLEEGLSNFMGKNILQSDNGGWMEQLLIALGAEAAEKGNEGYNNECQQELFVSGDLDQFVLQSPAAYSEKNRRYSSCFFKNFERLAGPVNQRYLSKHIRINPLMDAADSNSDEVVPWANCWSLLSDTYFSKHCVGSAVPSLNCFAFHWNGRSKLNEDHTTIQGVCPDRSFNWKISPYNPRNRRKP